MKAQDRKIILRDATLSSDERFLFVLIDTWADKDGKNCFPSCERLIRATGWHGDKFWKVKSGLEKKGHLEVKKLPAKNGFRRNSYTLKIRGYVYPQNPGTTKSLIQRTKNDDLSVESEAILRALPDPVKEDAERYG